MKAAALPQRKAALPSRNPTVTLDTKRAIGLWEIMQQFFLKDFNEHYCWLIRKIEEYGDQSGSKEEEFRKLDSVELREIRFGVERLLHDFHEIEMEISANQAFLFLGDSDNEGPGFEVESDCGEHIKISEADINPIYVRDVNKALNQIHLCVIEELSRRKFVFVGSGKDQFLESPKPFDGLKETLVYYNFPSARGDIRAAGNCIALDLNTAAIFHLMRVMEFGLLQMYKKLLKRPPQNPNWSNLIRDIEDEIRARDKISPRAALWKKQRDFYIEAARHFYFFKDKRNHSIHVELSLEDYPQPNHEQAVRIFNEVKSFIQHLATKIKE